MNAKGMHGLVGAVLWFAGFAGVALTLPAEAYRNDIRIQVAEGRLSQCGSGWDPERTGHWRGRTGKIYVEGQLVHQFDLASEAECSRVVTTSVEAADRKEIAVKISVDEVGDMSETLRAVGADRVWRVQYFSDSVSGDVISTDWPDQGAASTAAPGAPGQVPISIQPGQVWHVVETMGSQQWFAEWQVRADGRSFDGTWRHEPGGDRGTLTNFAAVAEIDGHDIVIHRSGLGDYSGTISGDGRRIQGRSSWCDCTWEVELGF